MNDERPPTEPPDELRGVSETRWPRVIGVLSLIYALLGMTCVGFSGVWVLVAPHLPEMFRGGAEIPGVLRLSGGIQSVLLLIVGIVMLTGAIALLRRRPEGVSRLKKWAVVRLVLLVLGIGVAILTGPAQVQLQRSVLEFQQRMVEERGGNVTFPFKTDDQIWRALMINVGVVSALQSVYPLFIGFYLSRRKIAEEIEHWT